MASPAQQAANRQNALQSVGPKTANGKARSAKNALQFGIRSDRPVLPGEVPEDWEAHRAGIVQSLAPVGTLEAELAARVALCLWRLRRLAAYETAVTTVGLEEVADDVRPEDDDFPTLLGRAKSDPQRLHDVEKELTKKRDVVTLWDGTLHLLERLPELADTAPVDGDDAYGLFQDLIGTLPENVDVTDADDARFLATVGVPADEQADAYQWCGWTAGMVRKGLALVAKSGKRPPERLLAQARQDRQTTQQSNRDEAKGLERQARDLRRRIKTQDERMRQRRMLPDGATLDKVARYEAHVSRQMLQALHTLERLQATRAGQTFPPPAAVDVTVDAPVPAALASMRDTATAE